MTRFESRVYGVESEELFDANQCVGVVVRRSDSAAMEAHCDLIVFRIGIVFGEDEVIECGPFDVDSRTYSLSPCP